MTGKSVLIKECYLLMSCGQQIRLHGGDRTCTYYVPGTAINHSTRIK